MRAGTGRRYSRDMSRKLCAALLILVCVNALGATQGGPIPVRLPLFPMNNWWNVDISSAPLDPGSATFMTSPLIGGPTQRVHPDFGGIVDDGSGDVYGIPYIVVDGAQAKKIVDFVEYPGESDGVGQAFYPVPDEAITMNGWVEGGQPGNVPQDGDRHVLIVDETNNHLYELYHSFYNGTNWEAGSGAFFDMNTNNRRPETWTSADAAGLAILPGLVRYDEVFGPDEIRHAFRVTVQPTNGHVFPASHTAGSTSGALPMGARLRLKASKDISSYPASMQKIFRAMKKYGLIVADNGSDMYVSGAYHPNWDNDILNPAFHSLKVSDFEVIQLGWQPPTNFVLTLPANVGASDAVDATLTAYGPNYTVATGYTGTVHFTSTDGAATLPVDYTFTGADAGTHTFPAGFILRTAGSQIVTVTDVANATITGSVGVAVGPPTPAGFSATAVSTGQVNLTWAPSAGATQYEIMRRSAGAFTTLTTTASTSYSDLTVAAGTAYVYRVRAIDASARPSSFTAPDAATTILFTDDALIVGVVAKAVHVTELRSVVNAMRTAAGLGAGSFTDAAPLGVIIKAIHIEELRTQLAPARAALGLTASAFTDPTLNAGATQVKSAHVQDLRNALK